MLGKPTCKRYCHATVYVDQPTGLGFIWLQKSVDLEDTMEGKTAFKRFCQEHRITIYHYHVDHGIQQQQGLTSAGVAAHHQNGIVKRGMRELQEIMHIMLIHSHHRWPHAITQTSGCTH